MLEWWCSMDIKSMLMATSKEVIFPEIGGKLEGGYYVGNITRSDGDYALIVSPKATGESSTTLKYRDTNTTTNGCQSLNDGAANTATMVGLGNSTVFPAAHFCNNLSIGGYTDWYFPARDELELAYRNLKPTTDSNKTDDRPKSDYVYSPDDISADTVGVNRSLNPVGAAYTSTVPTQTSIDLFKTGGSESFAQSSETSSFNRHWSSTEFSSTTSWYQPFSASSSGYQYRTLMDASYSVRAFRALKL